MGNWIRILVGVKLFRTVLARHIRFPARKCWFKNDSNPLNHRHLNTRIIWIRDFIVVMWLGRPLKYCTKFSPVFRNHSKEEPFANQTHFNHLNTRLAWDSDDHCSLFYRKHNNQENEWQNELWLVKVCWI
jgi:hypothetical protein